MFRIIKSIFRSAVRGAEKDPELVEFEKRHKKFFEFVQRRLDPDTEFGLRLTIGVLITLGFAWFFFGILQDLIGQDPLVRADLRIINLFALYRTSILNHVMLFITDLGVWQVIFLGLLFVSIILALLKRWKTLLTLIISVGVGQLILGAMKLIIHRPRPSIANALVFENSFSFPSGHSFVAMSFYGFLTYIIFVSVRNKWAKALTLISGILVILLIGFSRIYLGAHFPSDVLAGYAAGGAWIAALITSLEIRRREEKEKPKAVFAKNILIIIGLIFFVAWATYLSYFYKTHPLKEAIPPKVNYISLSTQDVPGRLFQDLPKTSETLTGQPMEPINIIVVATKEELDKAFADGGWYQTDPVSIQSSWRIAVDSVLGHPYKTAPGTPSFWNTMPNPFAYEQPTGNNPRQRYHIHFWPTPYNVNGVPVWFSTAHFDETVGFNGIVPTHKIDPNVDAQREKVKADLEKTNLVTSTDEFQLVKPLVSKNAAGSLFFTDGKAEVIYLK